MAIPNYTTSISADKSIAEIQKILVKKGAIKFICDYDQGLPSAVSFGLKMGEQMTFFTMPANYVGMLRAMQKDPAIPRSFCTNEQSVRVAWRVIKVWIISQLALIEAGLAEMPEVFLPYAVTKSGTTLYKEIKQNNTTLLNS